MDLGQKTGLIIMMAIKVRVVFVVVVVVIVLIITKQANSAMDDLQK